MSLAAARRPRLRARRRGRRGGPHPRRRPRPRRRRRAARSASPAPPSSCPRVRPMRRETWFDLASLTKVIFTTPRILAPRRGRPHRPRRPADHAPARPAPVRRRPRGSGGVTFRQCLGHQTPFPAVEPIYTYGRTRRPAARLRPAARVARRAAGLFRHQLHPARHRARAAGRPRHPRHGPRPRLRLVRRPGRLRRDRGLHLAPPRPPRRGPRRQLLGPRRAPAMPACSAPPTPSSTPPRALLAGTLRHAGPDPRAPLRDPHPRLGAAPSRLVRRRRLLGRDDRPYRLHRHRPLDRLRAPGAPGRCSPTASTRRATSTAASSPLRRASRAT